jgi:fermentation-respiration switch protein FrsA (DUF1100 family)
MGATGANATIRHILLTAVACVLVFLVVLWLAQRSLIYFPHGQVPAPTAVGLTTAEIASFTTDDHLDLEAWFVPAREPSADRTIVVFNGNAGSRAHRGILAASFAERGFATLLVDYRGYGGNPGLPSERGLYRDARAALKYLAARGDVNMARIVYFGESLGAAVAVELASEFQPSALILRSPFSSMTRIGAHHYPLLPVRHFLRDRYPSIDRIGRIRCPLLVIAGDDDRIVPLEDTQRLFDAAHEPKQLVVIEGADHNDEQLMWGPRVLAAIARFLQ